MATYKQNSDGSITKTMASGATYNVGTNDPKWNSIANEAVGSGGSISGPISKTSSTPSSPAPSTGGQSSTVQTTPAATPQLAQNQVLGQAFNAGLTPTQFLGQDQPAAKVPLQEPYQFPFEQMWRDTIAAAPKYTPRSESELLTQSQQYAGLQIDPQLQALSKALAQLKQSADAERGSVDAAYSGLHDTSTRMLKDAEARALESAISRGGGRSGQVEWLTQKQQQPIMEQTTQAEVGKAAQLSAIANALALAERQGGETQQQLAERRGTLEASQLAGLRQLEHANATGDWQLQQQAVQNLAAMATQSNQFNQQLGFNMLPYTTLTEAQRQQQPIDWAQVMGQTSGAAPSLPSSGGSAVPLRSYATQAGASISYDPATKTVTINGKSYSPSALQSMGGQQKDGAWYLPESAIRGLI